MNKINFHVSREVKHYLHGFKNDLEKFEYLLDPSYIYDDSIVKATEDNSYDIKIDIDYVILRIRNVCNRIENKLPQVEHITNTKRNHFNEVLATLDLCQANPDQITNSVLRDLYKADRFSRTFEEELKYQTDKKNRFVYFVNVQYFNEMNELDSEESKVFMSYENAYKYYKLQIKDWELSFNKQNDNDDNSLLKIYESPDEDYYEIFDQASADSVHIYLTKYLINK